MCRFFKRNCLGLQKCLPLTQSPRVYAARSCGDLSSWHWNPGLGDLVWGWDSLLLKYPSWIFIHHTWGGTSPFCIFAPLTSLNGCGFLNSIVVRLPLNSISDGSELMAVLCFSCREKRWATSAYTTISTGNLHFHFHSVQNILKFSLSHPLWLLWLFRSHSSRASFTWFPSF